MDNGGKWQLAFWVVTVVCGIWLVCLTGGIVTNDRIRESEDTRIEDKVDLKLDKILTAQTDMKVDIGRIMERLGVRHERADSRTD